MKYLLLIPATFAFCLWIYFCFWFLPRQLRTTHIGEKIGPIIERFTCFFFLAYGLSSIVITVGIIVAERFGYATLVARKIKYTAYTYAPVVIGVGFLLLLALVVVLKTLQYFKIIR